MPSTKRRARRPPGAKFHLVVGLAGLLLLISVSVPGVAFFSGLAAAYVLGIGAVVWVVRGLLFVLARRDGRAHGAARWFLVAPLGGLLVVALVLADVPLRARFSLSEAAFDRALELAPAETSLDEQEHFEVPDRIGSYRITDAYRQGDAVIFYERTGSLVDDAGFAYLPSGSFPELENGGFERPSFRHLQGDWYAWTASW